MLGIVKKMGQRQMGVGIVEELEVHGVDRLGRRVVEKNGKTWGDRLGMEYLVELGTVDRPAVRRERFLIGDAAIRRERFLIGKTAVRRGSFPTENAWSLGEEHAQLRADR